LTAGGAAAALAPAVPDGQGVAADESGAGSGVTAGPVGVGAAVWPVLGALVPGAAGLVCAGAAGLVCAGAAAWLLAGLAGGDVAGADEAAPSATAEPSIPAAALAVASPGAAGPAGPAAAAGAQFPAWPVAVLEAVSIVLRCGTAMIAIPAASATASSATIGSRPRRGLPAKIRA
jgi:flagellar hook-length control protein FliK